MTAPKKSKDQPAPRISVIGTGYLGAFAAAWFAVGAYIGATSGPDRDLYQGMFAFGDSLYFLAVSAVAAVPATALALYFLRPYAVVWRTLAVMAVALAATWARHAGG